VNLETTRDLKTQLVTLIPNVGLFTKHPLFAVGVALTPTAGEYRLAIRFRQGRDAAILERKPLATIIARAGRDLDIKVTGTVRVMKPRWIGAQPAGPLKIGSSISHEKGYAGTLGFFARAVGPPLGPLGLVSCNHVIADYDSGAKDDDIISPAVEDNGSKVIADLSDKYPLLFDGGVKVADCAFAVIKNRIVSDPKSLGRDGDLDPTPITATKHLKVRKLGRTTGRTEGIVTACDLDCVSALYGLTVVVFNDVIEIEPDGGFMTMADGGDSGALIYSDANRPVGLLFAESDTGGSMKTGFAYANPVCHVTSKLGVELVTA
jgi:hypothetical protein